MSGAEVFSDRTLHVINTSSSRSEIQQDIAHVNEELDAILVQTQPLLTKQKALQRQAALFDAFEDDMPNLTPEVKTHTQTSPKSSLRRPRSVVELSPNMRDSTGRTTMTAGVKRLRHPQAVARNHDLDLATEIGEGLVEEIRKLQAQLHDKDELLKDMTKSRVKQERAAEELEARMLSALSEEEKFKAINWDLELKLQQNDERLKSFGESQSRLESELSRMMDMNNQQIEENERVRVAHEKAEAEIAEMRTNHSNALTTQKEIHNDLRGEITDLMQRLETVTTDMAAQRTLPMSKRDYDSSPKRLEEATLSDEFDTPPGSPPLSPIKGTPHRNATLESETLKGTLFHNQTKMLRQRKDLEREKVQRISLQRQLKDTEDELESMRQLMTSQVPRRRLPKISEPKRKGIRANAVFNAGRLPTSESSLLTDDPFWENTDLSSDAWIRTEALRHEDNPTESQMYSDPHAQILSFVPNESRLFHGSGAGYETSSMVSEQSDDSGAGDRHDHSRTCRSHRESNSVSPDGQRELLRRASIPRHTLVALNTELDGLSETGSSACRADTPSLDARKVLTCEAGTMTEEPWPEVAKVSGGGLPVADTLQLPLDSIFIQENPADYTFSDEESVSENANALDEPDVIPEKQTASSDIAEPLESDENISSTSLMARQSSSLEDARVEAGKNTVIFDTAVTVVRSPTNVTPPEGNLPLDAQPSEEEYQNFQSDHILEEENPDGLEENLETIDFEPNTAPQVVTCGKSHAPPVGQDAAGIAVESQSTLAEYDVEPVQGEKEQTDQSFTTSHQLEKTPNSGVEKAVATMKEEVDNMLQTGSAQSGFDEEEKPPLSSPLWSVAGLTSLSKLADTETGMTPKVLEASRSYVGHTEAQTLSRSPFVANTVPWLSAHSSEVSLKAHHAEVLEPPLFHSSSAPLDSDSPFERVPNHKDMNEDEIKSSGTIRRVSSSFTLNETLQTRPLEVAGPEHHIHNNLSESIDIQLQRSPNQSFRSTTPDLSAKAAIALEISLESDATMPSPERIRQLRTQRFNYSSPTAKAEKVLGKDPPSTQLVSSKSISRSLRSQASVEALAKNDEFGMAPPVAPSSARDTVRRKQNLTYSKQHYGESQDARPRNSVAASVRNSIMPQPTRSYSQQSISSISSLASELDEHVNQRYKPIESRPLAENPTDPATIESITRTMIGMSMYKYTRRTGRKDLSHNRHRRYFWLHPYTRTLYWSVYNPVKAPEGAIIKSAPILTLSIVDDLNTSPPGLHQRSLCIDTPRRTLKLTALQSIDHEDWVRSLNFLLFGSSAGVQTTEEAKETDQIVRDFSPSLNGAFPPRGQEHASDGTELCRTASQEALKPRPEAQPIYDNRSLTSKFGSYFSRSKRSRAQSSGTVSLQRPSMSSKDARTWGNELTLDTLASGSALENVRTCCGGRHDVTELCKRSSTSRSSSRIRG